MKKIISLLTVIFILVAMTGIYIPVIAEEIQEFNTTVSGYASKAEFGQGVTLTVFMPGMTTVDWVAAGTNDGVVAYFQQSITDENGYYEFSFNLDREMGTYMAVISVSGESGVRIEYLSPETELRFESDFEGYFGNAIPEGWDEAKFHLGNYRAASGRNGGTALMVNPTDGARLTKRFDNQSTGIYLLSFDYMTESTSALNYIRLLTTDFDLETYGNSERYTMEIFYSSGTGAEGALGHYKNSSGFTDKISITEYEANSWYRIEAWIDLDLNKVTYCIDNEHISEASIDDTGLTGIMLIMGQNRDNEVYLDNFLFAKMSSGEILQREFYGQWIPEYLKNDARVVAQSDKTGNIFYDDEEIRITCTVHNHTKQKEDYVARFRLTDYDGEIVWTSSETVSADAMDKVDIPLDLSGIAYGAYTLSSSVENSSGEIICEDSVELSRCVYAKEVNENIGVNTHYNDNYRDFLQTVPLIRKAGFGLTREIWGWKEAESGYGEYTQTQLKSAELLKSEGVNTLPILKIDNSYIQSKCAKGHLYCVCESGLDAIEEWAKHYVLTYAEKVPFEYVEIGNEPNHSAKLNRGVTAQMYGAILERCYKGIKAASEELGRDIKVVGFSASGIKAGVDVNFIKEALATTDERIVDAISIHPYHQAGYMPEETAQWRGLTWVEYSKQLVDLKEECELDGVELWATETGWETLGSVTQKQQAEWSVRLAAINEAYNLFDRILIYETVNSGISESVDDDCNYGIINTWTGYNTPYAAKLSYLALANYNNLLSGATSKGEPEISDNVYTVGFTKRDGSDMYMVWSLDGKGCAALDLGDASRARIYDMYGNSTVKILNDGILTVDADTSPVYVEAVEGICVKLNGKELASASEVKVGDILNISADISDYSGSKTIIFAAYNNDYLVDVKIEVCTDIGSAFEIECIKEFDHIKVFAFDSIDNLRPLCSSFEL